MSKILESAILRSVPGAEHAYVDEEFALVKFEGDAVVRRYRLSTEARRIALLEREGRPKDIRLNEEVLLLAPGGAA